MRDRHEDRPDEDAEDEYDREFPTARRTGQQADHAP
jgi:hypothetical protein